MEASPALTRPTTLSALGAASALPLGAAAAPKTNANTVGTVESETRLFMIVRFTVTDDTSTHMAGEHPPFAETQQKRPSV
jgi:hypothetical protein